MKKILILSVLFSLWSGSASSHGGGEVSSKVGLDKGIVEASEGEGIKLSPEAFKNFEIKTVKLTDKGPWEIPGSALMLSGEEVNVYRLRNDFFKRIDLGSIKKNLSTIVISSDDLNAGDEVVVNGVSFLRIAEISTFGEEEGHGHGH